MSKLKSNSFNMEQIIANNAKPISNWIKQNKHKFAGKNINIENLGNFKEIDWRGIGIHFDSQPFFHGILTIDPANGFFIEVSNYEKGG